MGRRTGRAGAAGYVLAIFAPVKNIGHIEGLPDNN
jgi:hypothetical protein